MSQLAFLVIAFLVVCAALGVILMRNAVHSALCLVSTLFLLAMLFLGLDAELIAILQIIVYAGAIVVLFLFVIMLLNVQTEGRGLSSGMLVGAGGLCAVAFVAVLMRGMSGVPDAAAASIPAGFGGTGALADKLFTAYLVPFELTSFLLLVAVVGAVAIAKRKY